MSRRRTLFSVQKNIAASPARVWEILSAVERWHCWTPSIRKVKRLDAGPLAVGARVVIVQPKLPPAFWRVTALTPGVGFTWVSSAPGIRVTATHTIEAVPDGALVTLSLEYNGALARIVVALVGELSERYIEFEAAGLKNACEKPGGTSQSLTTTVAE